jgi:hypothetical protein
MGFSIVFEDGSGDPHDGFPFDLATNSGWARAAEWIESLPAKQAPTLRALALDGSCRDTSALAGELAYHLKARPPKDKDVRHTLDQLLERIGDGDPDETATVID